MTRIAWGSTGERFFELGTDRGVLYLDDAPGVPWNGLKGVAEAPNGGEARPYYIDGFKYLNLATAEEFQATITAFGAPFEFGVCDGTMSIHNGLFVTQQPRKSFGLSYRTLIGNDTDQEGHGYKIHLVYNALAAPSSRANQTQSGSSDPLDLSWAITTTPPKLSGLKPTAHLVIDSRFTPPALLAQIEDILYGTEGLTPSLPPVEEMLTMFQDAGPIVRQNRVAIPRPNSYNAGIFGNWLAMPGFQTSPEPGWIGGQNVSDVAPYIRGAASMVQHLAGERVTMSIRYRVTDVGSGASFIDIYPYNQWGEADYMSAAVRRPIVLDQEEIVKILFTVPVDIPEGRLRLTIKTDANAGLTFAFRATEALIEPGWQNGSFFDGDTEDTAFAQYDWLGVAGASQSTMRSWY